MLRATIAAAAVGLFTTGVLADEDVMKLGRYQPARGGIAGSAASQNGAAADDDTVLTHGRRGWSRGGFSIGFYGGGYRGFGWPGYSYGYRSFYGRSSFGWPGYSYGYRSFYGSPWLYHSGLSYGYYQPGFALSVYSVPRYYSSYSYFAPRYCTYGLGYPIDARAGYYPITGGAAATVTLDLPSRPLAPISLDSGDPLRYDGGPARPIPLPAPDRQGPPQRIETAQESDSLPISLKKPKYTYPAYGDR